MIAWFLVAGRFFCLCIDVFQLEMINFVIFLHDKTDSMLPSDPAVGARQREIVTLFHLQDVLFHDAKCCLIPKFACEHKSHRSGSFRKKRFKIVVPFKTKRLGHRQTDLIQLAFAVESLPQPLGPLVET